MGNLKNLKQISRRREKSRDKKTKFRPKSRRIAKRKAPIHYRCNICTKYFNSASKLTKHKFTHRTMWLCELCDNTFATERLLMLHQKVHPKVLKHMCKFCGCSSN